MSGIDFSCKGPENGGNFEYDWSDTFLAAHVISDVGKRRERNEDACLLCAPRDVELLDGYGYLFAVADGMGGASAGEHASALALSAFSEAFYRDGRESVPERIRSAIEDANLRVFQEAEENPEYHGMGTTLSAVTIVGDCAYVGQVGDSRVYLFRQGGELVQVTEDHSLVAEQLRGGIISEEEARSHALKNLITRAIGIKDRIEADLFGIRIEKGDALLLCSDGLSNMVENEAIVDALKMDSLRSAARFLIGKALEAGGPDNISVAVIRVIDAPPHKDLQEGCETLARPETGLWTKFKRMFS